MGRNDVSGQIAVLAMTIAKPAAGSVFSVDSGNVFYMMGGREMGRSARVSSFT